MSKKTYKPLDSHGSVHFLRNPRLLKAWQTRRFKRIRYGKTFQDWPGTEFYALMRIKGKGKPYHACPFSGPMARSKPETCKLHIRFLGKRGKYRLHSLAYNESQQIVDLL